MEDERSFSRGRLFTPVLESRGCKIVDEWLPKGTMAMMGIGVILVALSSFGFRLPLSRRIKENNGFYCSYPGCDKGKETGWNVEAAHIDHDRSGRNNGISWCRFHHLEHHLSAGPDEVGLSQGAAVRAARSLTSRTVAEMVDKGIPEPDIYDRIERLQSISVYDLDILSLAGKYIRRHLNGRGDV